MYKYLSNFPNIRHVRARLKSNNCIEVEHEKEYRTWKRITESLIFYFKRGKLKQIKIRNNNNKSMFLGGTFTFFHNNKSVLFSQCAGMY
jgi:hypothetical protein